MNPKYYLRVILAIAFGTMIYLIANEDKITNGNQIHCGWNGNIYIKCNGEEEIDMLIKKY